MFHAKKTANTPKQHYILHKYIIYRFCCQNSLPFSRAQAPNVNNSVYRSMNISSVALILSCCPSKRCTNSTLCSAMIAERTTQFKYIYKYY